MDDDTDYWRQVALDGLEYFKEIEWDKAQNARRSAAKRSAGPKLTKQLPAFRAMVDQLRAEGQSKVDSVAIARTYFAGDASRRTQQRYLTYP